MKKKTKNFHLRVIFRKGIKRFRNRIKKKRKRNKKNVVQFAKENSSLHSDDRVYTRQRTSIREKVIPYNLASIFRSGNKSWHPDKLKKIRLRNDVIKVPKIFSIIKTPRESYKVIYKVLKSFLSSKYHSLVLDYYECVETDLVTEIFLDAILKDIAKLSEEHLSYVTNKGIGFTKIQGIRYDDISLQKMMNSVGSPQILMDKTRKYHDVTPFHLRYHRLSEKQMKDNQNQNEKDATDLMEYIQVCLAKFKRKLLPEEAKELGCIIGEILINAEEHSSTKCRYVIGYMEDSTDKSKSHTGIFNLVIMNFGKTIYEKFKYPSHDNDLNQECLQQMEQLTKKFRSRNILNFSNRFTEETLWTLYTLQEGVTCVPNSKRGNGTIQFIESFFKLKGSDEIDDISRMYILSGKTMIEFDGKYRLVNKQVISFNESGNLLDAPDHRYVKTVEHYFPGTAIFVRLLMKDN